MDDGSPIFSTPADVQAAARAEAYAMPLEAIDVAQPRLYHDDTWRPYFERLRNEAPVHWAVSPEPDVGGYWSLSRFDDIVAMETNHEVFSNIPTVSIRDHPGEPTPSFIAMDEPEHAAERKTVTPIVSPAYLAHLAPIVRERAAGILDELPIGETFDWVDKVSVELTTMTLATLLDFPWEERRNLTLWSDAMVSSPQQNPFGVSDPVEFHRRRTAALEDCLNFFSDLWDERAKAPRAPNLLSMMAHGPGARNVDRFTLMGILNLLIVGGNDTTRNTISGSVLALNLHPDQDRLIRSRPDLVPALVLKSVRWQTPILLMRRTALRDCEVGGKTIRKGEKVAMWYISGNRDETAIERPDDFWIDRPRVRHHMSFGFGIHRCVGNRLAELQLRIIWEEILKRFPKIEVVGPPQRSWGLAIHGIEHMPVVIPTPALRASQAFSE